MKEKWEFMSCKLPEFVQKCSKLTLEHPLTLAKEFKNLKEFNLMQMCIQNINFRAKVVIIAILLYNYKKLKEI